MAAPLLRQRLDFHLTSLIPLDLLFYSCHYACFRSSEVAISRMLQSRTGFNLVLTPFVFA